MESLIARNVGRPELAIIDGNPGLGKALEKAWPKIDIQRCTNRVSRFRIVYRVAGTAIEIVAVGPRRTIYEETWRRVRSRPSS